MKNKFGKWIPLKTTPERASIEGYPSVGDTVELVYKENDSYENGAAMPLIPVSSTEEKQRKSPEYGADFIFSANFGVF